MIPHQIDPPLSQSRSVQTKLNAQNPLLSILKHENIHVHFQSTRNLQ